MSRLVIDLTEFKAWNGHLTGVQRVVHGIATSITTHDVVYVSYDKTFDQFEIDSIDNYQIDTEAASTATNQADAQAQNNLKSQLKSLYFKVPLNVRKRISHSRKQQLKKIAKRSYAAAVSMKDELKSTKTVQTVVHNQPPAFSFKDGDVLFIAGRLWDYPKCIDYLAREKRRRKLRIATVIYDLVPIYQQHTFGPGLTEPYTNYIFEMLTHADYLLPISESSKRDLLRAADEFGFLELPKIETFRLGDEISDAAHIKKPKWITETTPFALCVGTIEARKNHALLYYAYKLAHERGVDLPHLYIAGKRGWLTDDVIYFFEHDADVKDKISIVANLPDAELNWLYKNARFTLYPSQYEGWGLPIAESLLHGTPCIASHTSSMSEIAPRLVDHISPFDSSELLRAMIDLSQDSVNQMRRQQIAKGYRTTAWADSAKQVSRIIGLH